MIHKRPPLTTLAELALASAPALDRVSLGRRAVEKKKKPADPETEAKAREKRARRAEKLRKQAAGGA